MSVDAPTPPLLGFSGGGSFPVQYRTTYGGREIYVRYRHSWLTIDVDDVEVVACRLVDENDHDGTWSDEETNVYLHVICDALVRDALATVALPTKAEVHDHPLFRRGPWPRYHALVCDDAPPHRHTATCFSDVTFAAEELDELHRKR